MSLQLISIDIKTPTEMKKIFPFYKGENIASNPLGYTNEKNARLRMKKDKVVEDFRKTLPDDYWLDYYYVCELEKPWSEDIKPGRYYNPYNVNTSRHWCNITIYTDGYTKPNSHTYIKKLPEDVYNLFIEMERQEKIITGEYHKGNPTDRFRDDYQSILHSILRVGFYPHLFTDESDYKKRYKKFVTENVEFREMDVSISVR